MTCLCLTRNRPEWLVKAIRCFQSQTYERRELLVVADGSDVGRLIPNDERIRYVHFAGQQPIGTKRNLGCERARGEVVLHWDDDDWSAAGRTAFQLEHLAKSGAEVSGFRTLLFWDLRLRQAWRYNGTPLYAVGTSLCYRRRWWREHPFPDKQVCEDGWFVERARALGAIAPTEDFGLMVATSHSGNTSPRQTSGKQWTRVPESELPVEFPR